MAKIYDTLSKFGRAQTENLSKVWDVGLGSINPSKVWDSTIGEFVNNKVNDFTQGIRLGGGNLVTNIDSGTWSATNIASSGDWNIGNIVQEHFIWSRVNSVVNFSGRFTGTATTGGGGSRGTFDVVGLPDFGVATQVNGWGTAFIGAAPALTQGVQLVSNSAGDAKIFILIENNFGGGQTHTFINFSGSYLI